jgi:ComF family protein
MSRRLWSKISGTDVLITCNMSECVRKINNNREGCRVLFDLSVCRQFIRRVMGRAIDFLFPPQCSLCRKPVQLANHLCASCWSDLHWITGPVCKISGVPMPYDLGAETLCPAVIVSPPAYDWARAPLAYEGSARSLVSRFKYADQPELAVMMTQWMVAYTQQICDVNSLIVPVPLYRFRLLSRRYNQAAELARSFARQGNYCFLMDVLQRHRRTQPQVGLGKHKRKQNVRSAFRVCESGKNKLDGRHIILIDDVLTTGATVNACCKVLRSAGATSVGVITFARVV